MRQALTVTPPRCPVRSTLSCMPWWGVGAQQVESMFHVYGGVYSHRRTTER